MNLRASVTSLVLWSSFIVAKGLAQTPVRTATLTPVPQSSFAVPSQAFIYSLNKIVDPKNSHEIDEKTMPPIFSQDTVGSCFGCGPAVIAQKFLCDKDPQIKALNLPCNKVPPNHTIHQLSMLSWADTNEKKAPTPEENEKTNMETPGISENHENIKLYDDTSIFSSGSNALNNASLEFTFMAESCYPFDRLVRDYGYQSDKFKEIYGKAKKLYTKMKSPTQGSTNQCSECLKQLSDDLKTNLTQDSLKAALLKNSFPEFFHQLVFYNCKSLTSSERPQFNSMPGLKLKMEKKDIFKSIKPILDANHPILVETLCLIPAADKKKCESSHAVAVSGYRRVCPNNNLNDSKCTNQIKLHNCWGEDWQKANNDGWVDEETFFKQVNYPEGVIKDNQISWYE